MDPKASVLSTTPQRLTIYTQHSEATHQLITPFQLLDSNSNNPIRVKVSLKGAGGWWLFGNTLASDANGPCSTPGGTLELDTGYHPFVDR